MGDMAKKQYICNDTKLMIEWDWDENSKKGLYPDELTYGSTKKAYWICKNGHHYSARIDHRTIMKSGCPYCARKLPVKGVNDLETTHPHLLREWDYEQNLQEPHTYLAGSNKKANWICEKCGYSWVAKIADRALKNSKCPNCMRIQRGKTKTKNTIQRRGTLAQEYPDLALEWDFEKNGNLTPEQVHAGSKTKVWWIGKCNHSWSASIQNRVLGTGCPICAGKEVLAGFNDLLTKYPDVANEWHPTLNGKLKPNNVTAHSDSKIWWLCQTCGHSYYSSIYSRTSLHTGCPICCNKQIVEGYNDLETTHPRIAKEWNFARNGALTPTEVAAGSNKKVWWKCEMQHEWEATISSRTSGRECPICAKKGRTAKRQNTILLKRGSLLSRYPTIAEQWHPTKNAETTPDTVTPGSKKKVWWICEKGHEWTASIYSRVSGRGCPYCNFEHSTSFPEQALFFYLSQVTPAINRYMILSREIDIYLPEIKVGIEYNGRYYHANRGQQDEEKKIFLKEKGIRLISVNEGITAGIEGDNIYYQYVNSDYITLSEAIKCILKLCNLPSLDIDIERDRKQIYEQYIQHEKLNSLASKYPWVIEEWDYEKNGKLTPWQISYGSRKRVYWKCKKCGYQWSSVAYTRKKSGCPCCSNRVVVKGVNDLRTTHPNLATEWDYEKNDKAPTEVVAGSHQYAYWICKNGHSWRAQIKSRAQGIGCPKCRETKTH